MSLGFTAPHITEQEQLKKLYAKTGGRCPGICAEGHRVRGANVVRRGNKDYCRKCVEAGFINLERMEQPAQSVYFISDEHGNVKIGYATSVQARFADLQVANASELTIVLEMPGGPKLERELHRRFAEHRVRGEWFKLTTDILEYIASVRPKPRKVPEYVRIQRELISKQEAVTI
ncbi:hypothetical protein BTO20_05995 [Mycobacterium dioxanotrophicus]|uniref:Bacteriophage T5 Orf172 DNA-binding domain-containing protein n=1 Tax=Mycobacterium dioxanotrophicus TaxID=482462 RepID=A0A1Y0BZ89_9MYCO|nr:GIY-YIG nuclease family protein [Mycobacterium dioxanotrophicus]ART68194.1 hypothetical protein BTO20_05995 [Mycobacterium dioxanotrophicus]